MTAKTLWRWARKLFALAASIYFIGYAAEHIRDIPPLAWVSLLWVSLLFVEVFISAGFLMEM
jgi:hypothetical protein